MRVGHLHDVIRKAGGADNLCLLRRNADDPTKFGWREPLSGSVTLCTRFGLPPRVHVPDDDVLLDRKVGYVELENSSCWPLFMHGEKEAWGKYEAWMKRLQRRLADPQCAVHAHCGPATSSRDDGGGSVQSPSSDSERGSGAESSASQSSESGSDSDDDVPLGERRVSRRVHS